MKRLITNYAKYNSWATNEMIKSLIFNPITKKPVPLDDLNKDIKLYFNSVNGTIQHIILADELHYERQTGGEIQSKFGEVTKLWGINKWDGEEMTAWESIIVQNDTQELQGQQEESVENRSLDGINIHDINSGEELFQIWLENVARWVVFVETLSEEDLNRTFEYFDTAGKKFSMHRGESLIHIFNHGTHHRGQISAALVQMGYYCDGLDYSYSPFIEKTSLD